jgi:sulfur transfer protein SufE
MQLSVQFKTAQNQIHGCQPQVWVNAENTDVKVYLTAGIDLNENF